MSYEKDVLSYTDPPWYSSWILVAALDFRQVSGWRALHLEALLEDRMYRDLHIKLYAAVTQTESALCIFPDITCYHGNRLTGSSVWILTWSQTNSHFFSLSYWLNSFSLSGGRFMELWKTERTKNVSKMILYAWHHPEEIETKRTFRYYKQELSSPFSFCNNIKIYQTTECTFFQVFKACRK